MPHNPEVYPQDDLCFTVEHGVYDCSCLLPSLDSQSASVAPYTSVGRNLLESHLCCVVEVGQLKLDVTNDLFPCS